MSEKLNATAFRQKGIGFIGTILLIPLFLIVMLFGWYVFCEARKAYWDHQVKLMCEKDGGGIVYQELVLSADEFSKMKNKFGQLSIPDKANAKSDSIVFSETKDTYLHRSNPEVRRSEFSLLRRDGKLLAKQVIYSRVGGDFPSPAHASSFSCINIANKIAKRFDIERMTVQVSGENK